MTPRDRLVTVRAGASREEIKTLYHRHRIEKLPVVDQEFYLKGLVTVKDLEKESEYPQASKDELGRLRVAAAVGTGVDTEARVEHLVQPIIKKIVVDTAHGHSKAVIDMVRVLKQRHTTIDLGAGNIATAAAADALLNVGVDAVKVGIGPGSRGDIDKITGVLPLVG